MENTPIVILILIIILGGLFYLKNKGNALNGSEEHFDNTYLNYRDLSKPILKRSDIKTNPHLFMTYEWNEKDPLGNNIIDEIYYDVVQKTAWKPVLYQQIGSEPYDYRFDTLNKRDGLSEYHCNVDPHRRTVEFYGNTFTIV